jgi:hypothetical protein
VLGFVARDTEQVTLGHFSPEFGEAVAIDHAGNLSNFGGGVAVVKMEKLWIGGIATPSTGLLGFPDFEFLVLTRGGVTVFTLT